MPCSRTQIGILAACQWEPQENKHARMMILLATAKKQLKLGSSTRGEAPRRNAPAMQPALCSLGPNEP